MGIRDLNKELQLVAGVTPVNPIVYIDGYGGPFIDTAEAFSKVPVELREVGRPFGIYRDANKREVLPYSWGKNLSNAWIAIPLNTEGGNDGPSSNPFLNLITSGVKILSQLVVNEKGHTIQINARDLTAADIASIFLADNSNTSLTQTWSAKKIYDSIQAAAADLSTGALVYKGEYNPVTNLPDILLNGPVGGHVDVLLGYTYVISTEGNFLGTDVKAGDMLIAKVDSPGNDPDNWQVITKDIPAILQATETILGIVKLASLNEAYEGTDSEKAITAEGLLYALNNRFGSYIERFGDSSLVFDYPINHFLGTRDIQITIKDSDGNVADMQTRIVDDNNIIISLNRPLRRDMFYVAHIIAVLK